MFKHAPRYTIKGQAFFLSRICNFSSLKVLHSLSSWSLTWLSEGCHKITPTTFLIVLVLQVRVATIFHCHIHFIFSSCTTPQLLYYFVAVDMSFVYLGNREIELSVVYKWKRWYTTRSYHTKFVEAWLSYYNCLNVGKSSTEWLSSIHFSSHFSFCASCFCSSSSKVALNSTCLLHHPGCQSLGTFTN